MRRRFYQRRYVEDLPVSRAVRRNTPPTEGQIQAKTEQESLKRRRRGGRRVQNRAGRMSTMMTGVDTLG